jgi:hypothetical protein
MSEASEEPIAALRERIRWMGRGFAWLWLVIGAGSILAILGLDATIHRPWVGAFCAWFGATIASQVYIRCKQRQLRQLLVGLSAQERAELLTPLKEQASHLTSQIVAPFLADLGYREALPADAPTGRGDEPTP